LPEVIQTSAGETYLHLPGVIVTENITGEIRYLLADGLGSVRQAVDENGTVITYNEYNPYGNPTLHVSRFTHHYGYTGEWWQDDLDLLYLRARWYAPETGTFLSVDPVASQPPYAYVGGNVVNSVDPSGMEPPPQTPPPTGTPRPPWNPPPTPPPTGTPMPPYTPPPMGYILNKGLVFPEPCPPDRFKAGGYTEGGSKSFSLIFATWWQEGSEIVYDFATMERGEFEFHGYPPEGVAEDAIFKGVTTSLVEYAQTWYGIQLSGFRNWTNINDDYSGPFSAIAVGGSSPIVEIGTGGIYVYSPEITGFGTYGLGGFGFSPVEVSVSWEFTKYDELKPDLIFEYSTGGKITQEDVEDMKDDILTGRYVPVEPPLPINILQRTVAAKRLEDVWKYYHSENE